MRQRNERLARLHELAVEGRHPGIPVLGADAAAWHTEHDYPPSDELRAVWDALDGGDYTTIVTALTRFYNAQMRSVRGGRAA